MNKFNSNSMPSTPPRVSPVVARGSLSLVSTNDAGGGTASSSVALECHSRVILEELSAMVDEEGSDYESDSSGSDDDDDSIMEDETEDTEANMKESNNDHRRESSFAAGKAAAADALHNTDTTDLGLLSSSFTSSSPAEAEKADDVPLVRLRDAIVINREIRRGNSRLFRSRSARRGGSDFMERVIRSASSSGARDKKVASADGINRRNGEGKEAK